MSPAEPAFADARAARRAALAFDLGAPPAGFVDDPYPLYAALREHAPVQRQPDGSLLVCRHEALVAIYRDAAAFSSDKREVFRPVFGDSPLYAHHTTSLVFNDPPTHTRVRRIIVGALTPSAIARMEPGLVAGVDALLDALAVEGAGGTGDGNGEVDLIERFAARIPIEVIGDLFGVPAAERGPLRGWSLAILGALEPRPDAATLARGDEAVRRFGAYLHALAAARRRQPGDPETDVLTRLLGGGLDPETLVQNCIFILNAGHETTTNLIGNALALLEDRPEARAALLADPALVGPAVDECLRLESPNQLGNRLAVKACRIGDVDVSPGTNLHLGIGAANRDPVVFETPDELRLDGRTGRHLAFGGGPHACLGLNLARLEGRVAIGRFLARFPDYALTARERSPRLRFRGFVSLRARLRGADPADGSGDRPVGTGR